MAMVAGFIRRVYPNSRYGKTNLQEYLGARDGFDVSENGREDQ